MRFSSKNLAAFYYQLGTLIQAGLPIQSAVVSIQNTAPRRMRSAAATLSAAVNAGTPLHEAMELCGGQFPALDAHSIAMTESSGALDVGLLSLSKYYENRAAARSKLLSGSMYPILLLTAGVFISNFPAVFLGERNGQSYTAVHYLWDTAGLLVRAAVLVWVVVMLMRWAFTKPGLNLTLDRLLKAVPVFGRLRFDYALSQWVSGIRLMLAAGIGIVPALEAASRMVHSPLIADAYSRAAPLIGSQLDVSQALAFTGAFPEELILFWATGEQSGKMDEMLDRLARLYEERWRRSLDEVVTWMPRIGYGLVMLYVAWQTLTGFRAYINTLNSLMQD